MVEFIIRGEEGEGIAKLAEKIIEESEKERVVELAREIKQIEEGGVESIASSMVEKAIEKRGDILSIVYFRDFIDSPRSMSMERGERLLSEIRSEAERKEVDSSVKFHMSGSDQKEPISAHGSKYVGMSIR